MVQVKQLLLGVIGSGRIANRMVKAAKSTGLFDVCAVYNPRRESAARFASIHDIEIATDNLDTLADAVDAVYIASPHETHVSYAGEMLKRGRHVLCEKPMSFSADAARELFDTAEAAKLVLMEAFKTAYLPGFRKLLEAVKSGRIGDIVNARACFSRLPEGHEREVTDTVYGGSFTEFGSYPLLAIVKLFGTDIKRIGCRSITSANGIDMYTEVTLDYDRAFATAQTGLGVKADGSLMISGTEGYLLAPAPWWLTKRFELRHEDPEDIETCLCPFEGEGLTYELEVFARRIQGTDVDPLWVTGDESICIAGIMEEFLKTRESSEA